MYDRRQGKIEKYGGVEVGEVGGVEAFEVLGEDWGVYGEDGGGVERLGEIGEEDCFMIRRFRDGL